MSINNAIRNSLGGIFTDVETNCGGVFTDVEIDCGQSKASIFELAEAESAGAQLTQSAQASKAHIDTCENCANIYVAATFFAKHDEIPSDISVLRSKIDLADAAYYRVGFKPIMTDAAYDTLKSALKLLCPEDERFTRVGYQYSPEEFRTKVKHNIPMGSLDNTDDGISGFSAWYNSLTNVLSNGFRVLASLKMDGASVCATYESGKLVRVTTRGNGHVGDDITLNAINFIGLPTNLPLPINADVRGEAILYKDQFNAICDRDNIPESERSNPRNVGNGILGREDGKDSDKITFVPFNISVSQSSFSIESEYEKMVMLKDLGFRPVSHRLCSGITPHDTSSRVWGESNSVYGFYNEALNCREELPFEIDGVVVTVDDIAKQNVFITDDIKTKLRPKYARAIKFPHKLNTTKLIGVTLNVGHTRAIVPTAVFDEVRVGGVNVCHALLNNWDEIRRLDIAIGDEVEVGLAGDIIPKVLRKVRSGDDRQEIVEPKNCPVCGSNTTRSHRGKTGANIYCSNDNCQASMIEKIAHWIGTSRTGVGILGIGDSTLAALWDSKLVRDPADLYKLTPEMIADLKLSGENNTSITLGTERAKMIVNNINNKKELTLPVFLGSLGIDLLGRRRVELLSKESNGVLSTLDDWLNIDLLNAIDLPGLGDTTRSAIVSGISNNRSLIEKLLSVGVIIVGSTTPQKLKADVAISSDARRFDLPFSGFSFCLTGTRAYIEDIERLGGIIKSGVSKGLTFLVQADPTSTSTKTQKAEQYGTKIISVDYLKKAIDGQAVLSAD